MNCFIHRPHKRHNVSHYIYYLATDNIHIVLENDNTVLIKGLKKVVNVKFSENTHLIETSYDRVEIKRNHFSNTGKILLKSRSFPMGYKYPWTWVLLYSDNSLLFTESIQNTTNLSTLNHNVRFLPCQHRGVGILQYVYAKPCASF